MSKTFHGLGTVILALAMGAWADVTETTTITTGTVTEFVPAQTVVVRTAAAPAPIRYLVTRETTFVDELGRAVQAPDLSSGIPVVVHTMRDGDRLIASKIVVKRAPPRTKAEAKALKKYYDELEEDLAEGPQKAAAKALREYYDKLEEELDR